MPDETLAFRGHHCRFACNRSRLQNLDQSKRPLYELTTLILIY